MSTPSYLKNSSKSPLIALALLLISFVIITINNFKYCKDQWEVDCWNKDGSINLFVQNLEGPYANFWGGLPLISKSQLPFDGQIDAKIFSNGKLAVFNGTLNINCNNQAYFWKSANIQFVRGNIEKPSEYVPMEVILNLDKHICATHYEKPFFIGEEYFEQQDRSFWIIAERIHLIGCWKYKHPNCIAEGARQGDPKNEFILGVMFFDGTVLPKAPLTGMRLIVRSAKANEGYLNKRIVSLYSEMKGIYDRHDLPEFKSLPTEAYLFQQYWLLAQDRFVLGCYFIFFGLLCYIPFKRKKNRINFWFMVLFFGLAFIYGIFWVWQFPGDPDGLSIFTLSLLILFGFWFMDRVYEVRLFQGLLKTSPRFKNLVGTIFWLGLALIYSWILIAHYLLWKPGDSWNWLDLAPLIFFVLLASIFGAKWRESTKAFTVALRVYYVLFWLYVGVLGLVYIQGFWDWAYLIPVGVIAIFGLILKLEKAKIGVIS